MKILILTSKSHYYSNLLLRSLLEKGTFNGMEIFIVEQNSLVSGKSKIQGLLYYLKNAGVRYVFAQIVKQFVFSFRMVVDKFFHRSDSSFFPYYGILTNACISRMTVSSMRLPDVRECLRKFQPDIILSLYSKDILDTEILSLPSRGAVNLHPALLPSYRGVSPTFWVLANGEKITGATLHELDAGIDTGRIIGQTSFSIDGCSSEHQLYVRATIAGIQLVNEYMQKIKNGQIITSVTPNTVSSYFSVPTRAAVSSFYGRGFWMFTLNDLIKSKL